MSYQILQGDVLERVRELPDNSVDCIIADPPYGDTELPWDRIVPHWPSAVLRVLKPSGSMWVFSSLRHLMTIAVEFADWKYAQDIVWEKHNGSNSFADRFRRVHEHVVQFYRADAAWRSVYKQPQFSADAVARQIRRKQKAQHWSKIQPGAFLSVDGGPRLLRSVLACRSEHGRAIHPTQKPVELIELLLGYSCPTGGLVLDPFSGSASVGVAAKRKKMAYLGIDLNPEYVAMGEQRLREDSPLLDTPAPTPAVEQIPLGGVQR